MKYQLYPMLRYNEQSWWPYSLIFSMKNVALSENEAECMATTIKAPCSLETKKIVKDLRIRMATRY